MHWRWSKVLCCGSVWAPKKVGSQRGMARGWFFYKDLLPVVVIIGNECNDMGLFTLFKVATLQGMNNHVFVAYAYAVATITLLPVTLLNRRFTIVPCKIIQKHIYIHLIEHYLHFIDFFFMSLCRSRVVPPLSFSIISKIVLLGAIG